MTRAARSRENPFALPQDGGLLDDGKRCVRQGDGVLAAVLDPWRGNDPRRRRFTVELAPAGAADLASPRSGQEQQSERQSRRWLHERAFRRCRNPQGANLVIGQDALARRFATRLEACHGGLRYDAPFDGEREHFPYHREHTIGRHVCAPVADGVEDGYEVAPGHTVEAQSADRRQDVALKQALVFAPRALIRLGVALDIPGGELGDGRQAALLDALRPLLVGRVEPLTNERAP